MSLVPKRFLLVVGIIGTLCGGLYMSTIYSVQLIKVYETMMMSSTTTSTSTTSTASSTTDGGNGSGHGATTNNSGGAHITKAPVPGTTTTTASVVASHNTTGRRRRRRRRGNNNNKAKTKKKKIRISTATTSNTTTPITVIDVNAVDELNNNQLLPQWFTNYLKWHRDTKSKITPSNWHQFKYLVLRCLESMPFCSGTSDRLRNFIFPIYLAQTTQEDRIFLIHWGRPAPLEEFLVPPPNGLDWRIPSWLLPKLQLGRKSWQFKEHKKKFTERNVIERIRSAEATNTTVMELSFIWKLHQMINQEYANEKYHAFFDAVFEPSPPVKQQIEQMKRDLGLLNENGYVALHLRTQYTSIDENKRKFLTALECAASLGSGTDNKTDQMPIFVASDNAKVVHMVEQLATQHNIGRKVVTRNDIDTNPPLHIDMGAEYLNGRSTDWKNHNVSEYYGVFVDLLMLGGAQCVAAGKGSYGKWGRLLSQNYSCFADYNTGVGCST